MWMNGENSSIYFWLWLGDIIAFLRMDSVYYRFRNKIKSLFTAAIQRVRHKVNGKSLCTVRVPVPIVLVGEDIQPSAVLYMHGFVGGFAAFVNRHSERERNVKAAHVGEFHVIFFAIFVHTMLLSWIV